MILRISLLLIAALLVSEPGSLEADTRTVEDDIFASSEVLIAAHRGGYGTDTADGAPENSVANIRNCQRKGYHLYETDIQRTKDGHFVIVHDPTVDRETTGTGSAAEMSLNELKALHKKYRDGSVSEERVATLREFLVEGKGLTIFKADLKPGVSQHFEGIMKLVVEHDAMDGIVFRVPYREADQFARYVSSGAPYSRSLFMFRVSSRKQVDDIKARFDPLTIQINLSKSDPADSDTLELIRYATGQGLLIETHAEGTPDDWSKLIEAGVRMLHTSGPAKVQEFLRSRQETSP